jgi:hypothetical protein
LKLAAVAGALASLTTSGDPIFPVPITGQKFFKACAKLYMYQATPVSNELFLNLPPSKL